MLKIIQSEGPTRHKVFNDETKETYLVETNLYDGNGKCDCPHFQIRIEPHLRRGRRWEIDEFGRCEGFCKHIRRVWQTIPIIHMKHLNQEVNRQIKANGNEGP